jgi:single-strand DNA-binding protein
MGLNILTATGNLGKDATQRYTPNGDSIVAFSIPLEAGYGQNKVTTWINCSVFGKSGEGVLPYLKKGQQVGVVGEILLRPWTDKDGNERQSLELRVDKVRLLGSRPSETSASAVPQTETYGQDQSFSESDDIPFANPYRGRLSYLV